MFREVASEVRGLILDVVLGHLQTVMRGSAIIYAQFKPAKVTAVTGTTQFRAPYSVTVNISLN